MLKARTHHQALYSDILLSETPIFQLDTFSAGVYFSLGKQSSSADTRESNIHPVLW